MKNPDFYKYTIKQDTTIEELVDGGENGLFSNYRNKVGDLLQVEEIFLDGESTGTNLERIWDNYTEEQREDYESDYNAGTLSEINEGTEFVIPSSQTPIEETALTGEESPFFIEEGNFRSFWSNAFKIINNNSDYAPSIFDSNSDIVKKKNYNLSIWIYIRAIDQIMDITEFIYSVNTSTTMEGAGGNFNITLDGFSKLENIREYEGEKVIHYNYVDGERVNIPFFIKNLQQKDIVFIRYEKLKMESETDRENIRGNDYTIPKNELASKLWNEETQSFDKPKIYDMIGMVDVVTEGYSAAMNDITVTISGSDLSKLLVDDAAYFYPIMYAEQSDMIQIDETDNSPWFKRNVVTGNMESVFTFGFRRIKDSIGFVINQLSNLGVVPDDLFTGYELSNSESELDRRIGDRRRKAYIIDGSKKLKDSKGRTVTPYIDWAEVKGIWQIIDVLVDENVADRLQANGTLVNSEGTLMSFMDDICQKPLVEFFTDTYGDKFQFIAREQPFTKEAIRGYLKDNEVIEIKNEDVLSTNLQWEDEYYTWYQMQANNNFLGFKDTDSLGYLPIIYLPTYADKFGNSRYMISNNYLSRTVFSGDKENKINYDPYRKAVLDDLKRIVDMTSYLPFTRKGTITIVGDRRVKKGTFIRFKPTGEVYYVNGVSQSYSASRNQIQRTTTISVSRGMIERYVYENETFTEGVDGNNKLIKTSYFDIVDTSQLKDLLTDSFEEEGENVDVKINVRKLTTRTRFDVNEDAFNFFFTRRQFV